MNSNFDKAFKKTALSVAVMAAAGLTSVQAQEGTETDNAVLEEVVVTAVRGSLSRSLDIKRDSQALVDSISAEELGRFPDNNVADSLSHIPGITVSRTRGGEAQYVNIRGLGPEFSIVTLNNRILATDDGGRNFAFDVLPSEVISGADVWKSVEAKHIEGSIGGAVNLRTFRPLDDPGLQGVVSATGEYSDLSGELGTKLNAVFSNTFADDTLGVSVGVNQSSGTERSDDMFDNFYFGVNDGINIDVNEDGVITANEQNLVAPGSYALGVYETEFKRTGVTSTLQWRPSDKFELNADVLHTKLEADATGFTQSFFMVEFPGRWSNIALDGNVITGMDVSDVTMEVVTLDDHRTVDTTMFALNGEYHVNDQLTLTGDVYRSESERLSGGENTFVVAGAPGTHSGRFDLNDGGLPDYIPTWTEGRTSDDFGNNDFSPHWAARDGSDIEDVVTGLTLDGDFDFDDNVGVLKSTEFGVAITNREKTNTALDNYSLGACNYCGYPYTFGEVGADVTRPFPYDDLFAGDNANIPRSFPVFDIPSYGQGLVSADGQTLTDFNGNVRTFGANESALWTPVLNPVNSYAIKEDTNAAYVQLNFEGEGWFGNFGLRYVDTEVLAQYSYNTIQSIQIVGENTSNPSWDVVYSDSDAQEARGSYSKVLPALNFGRFLQEDLLLRVAAGQSLSRPTLDQLAPLTTDNAQSGLFTIDISGNPDIEPVFSDQFDLSLEWYFDEDSVLAGAIFVKKLEGFITDATTRTEIAGETFTISQPINGDTADVEGLEVSLQKFFDNGFGFTASYAYTDSSTVIDGVSAGPLPGVADNSYSLSLIYEDEKISTQLALDYTGELVANQFSPLGDDYQTTMDAQSIVTFSFQYNISDQTQVFLEGFNLTDESNRTFQGRSDLPGSIQLYGRTVSVGARYSF